MEKSRVLLGSIKGEKTGQTAAPKSGERQATAGSHGSLEQRLKSGNCHENQCWVGKPELQLTDC